MRWLGVITLGLWAGPTVLVDGAARREDRGRGL